MLPVRARVTERTPHRGLRLCCGRLLRCRLCGEPCAKHLKFFALATLALVERDGLGGSDCVELLEQPARLEEAFLLARSHCLLGFDGNARRITGSRSGGIARIIFGIGRGGGVLELLPRELLGSLELQCRHPRTTMRSSISNVSGDSRERRLCSRRGTRHRGHTGFEEWWWRRKHPRVFHMGEHLEGGSQLELSARDPQRAEAISHCEIAARFRRAP